MQNMSWNVTNKARNSISMMSKGNNGERQQKLIERTRKIDQQITSEKRKICQRNRRKEEKTPEEDKSYEKIK